MKQENPIIVFVVISSYFIFSVNVDSPYFLVSGANAIQCLALARLHKHRAPGGLAPRRQVQPAQVFVAPFAIARSYLALCQRGEPPGLPTPSLSFVMCETEHPNPETNWLFVFGYDLIT